MDRIELTVQPRSVTGKAVRRLRRDGIIPIVLYGGAMEDALSLQVNERELSRTLQRAGGSSVVYLSAEGTEYPALARTVDRHPTRNDILHVDFLSVRLDRVIQAEIPLVTVGEAELATNNLAILMQLFDRLTVEALPQSLPNQIEIDISGLTEIGQQLTVADLSVAEDVTLIADPEMVIVTLAAPTRPAEEETVAEEGVEGVELAEGEEPIEGEEGDETED